MLICSFDGLKRHADSNSLPAMMPFSLSTQLFFLAPRPALTELSLLYRSIETSEAL